MSVRARNLRQVLVRRVQGLPEPDDFRLEEADMPALKDGEVLVHHSHIGLAPAGWIRMSEETGGYPFRTEVGEAVYSSALGEVIESRDPLLPVGTQTISIDGGWQTHAIGTRDSLTVVDASRAPASAWLGLLGVSGFTAYAALHYVAGVKSGETVVISSAAGAVGSAAVQFARRSGCRVIGIAGGAVKCDFVTAELGAEACVDHSAADFVEALGRACPEGVDVYHDNVGGRVRDAVWPLMREQGRIVVCGQISDYSTTAAEPGPNWYSIMTKSLRIEGLNWAHHWHRFDEFVEDVAPELEAGRLHTLEHVVEGLDQAPAAFRELLEGRHLGKVVIAVDPATTPVRKGR